MLLWFGGLKGSETAGGSVGTWPYLLVAHLSEVCACGFNIVAVSIHALRPATAQSACYAYRPFRRAGTDGGTGLARSHSPYGCDCPARSGRRNHGSSRCPTARSGTPVHPAAAPRWHGPRRWALRAGSRVPPSLFAPCRTRRSLLSLVPWGCDFAAELRCCLCEVQSDEGGATALPRPTAATRAPPS
jgi:hypothetical protein